MPAPGIESWLIKWVIDEIKVVFILPAFYLSPLLLSMLLYPQLWDWMLKSPNNEEVTV